MASLHQQKMMFAEHLALMIKGGIPLTEALSSLKQEIDSKAFVKALDNILKRMMSGESMNKGMEKNPALFDKFFINIIKVGEESGSLEENLRYLSSYLKSEYQLRKKVSSALTYPVAILVVALIILTIMSVFVMPKLVGLFAALSMKLPLATRILLALSDFIRKKWFLMTVFFIIFVIGYRMLSLIEFFRFHFHRISLNLPFFGRIYRDQTLTRLSWVFFTLLKSGMPLLDSLDICTETALNEVYKIKLKAIRVGVERGEKMSKTMKEFSKIFPSLYTQMVAVGENTGSLEESIKYLAEFYGEEVDSSLKQFSGNIETFLLILLGLFVAFIALAIIVPIYQFTGSIINR